MRSVLDMLIKANYRIVCIPESSPVSQTFDVRKVIEGIRARPSAIVINNVRGEAHESAVIARLNEHKLLLIQIPHQPGLLDEDNPNRISSLLDIGSWISRPLE